MSRWKVPITHDCRRLSGRIADDTMKVVKVVNKTDSNGAFVGLLEAALGN